MVNKRCISGKEVEKLYSISNRTLQTMRQNGEGPPYVKLSSRKIVYKVDDLEAWIDSRRMITVDTEL